MSGVFVLAPVLTVAPVVFSATTAVAAAMGFAFASQKIDQLRELVDDGRDSETVACLDIGDAAGLTRLVNEQGPIVLRRDDATLCFRPLEGRVRLTVTSPAGRSKTELEALGSQVLGAISQQYAYHAVMTDLKSRGFDKVEEVKDHDGAIRLRLRRWD